MADPKKSSPLTRDSVIAAHELIKEHIHYTPVLTNTTLTELASTPQSPSALVGTPWEGQEPAKPVIRLWFKCENLQKVGAFKVRGAFHALKRLMAEEGWEEGGGREKGVVTHSSGNHAQALSLAARTMNIPAHIVMPTISTPSKIAATKSYGARVIFSGSTSTEREAVVADVVKDTGARLVPPYDHPDIMLGQGTLGIELQEQVEKMIASGGTKGQTQPKCSFSVKEGGKGKGLDAVIAPCGGGGMLSGVALSAENTGIFVFGAEPEFEGADDCKRGFESGKRVEVVKTLTIADGLRTPVGAYPWSIIYERRLVRQMFSVSEDMIKKALRLVLERMKVVVEPSAVVPLAVALFNEDFRKIVEKEGGEQGWDLGTVFSGGNVSLEAIGKLFAVPDEKAEGKGG
ncbi:related to threonine dehydratase [Phialocephala subalpina]|uniref:Related to threonine dehydratase n=1 Tax=Phialocephala subalpina TaxID=576137 RepID=A0A1L7X440_9HELO|nr:related to threonine dehydratase [Phialocephala subalpina]